MIVVFVHGWSVTDTATYARLPETLEAQASDYGLDIQIKHIWLGKYISFHDEVSVADVARAFDRALRDQVASNKETIDEFSCITHSTGGPVVREWINRFYGAENISKAPLKHLIMLAPANHGSALAALGKKKVGRIKAWFAGVEPGQRILNWLCLGSQQQINLAADYLDYKISGSGFFPFVLTGETIDKQFYDFLNSYLVEPGSDGVVRVAGANMNYSMIKLHETTEVVEIQHGPQKLNAHLLQINDEIKRPEPTPIGVVPNASHSGDSIGIMGSILSPKAKDKPQVEQIFKCLQVNNDADYKIRSNELEQFTKNTQEGQHRYIMLVFVIKDDQGDPVTDYDLFLLGGSQKSPDELSKGFFVDRQQNVNNKNHLVYYVNYDVITKNHLTGFRIIARPSEGFSFYHTVEYQSNDVNINEIIKPNETFYVEITLHRCVDKNAFRFDNASSPQLEKKGLVFKSYTRDSFEKEKPKGEEID